MASENLNKEEIGITKKCLLAVCSGNYVPEYEFETLIGVSVKEAELIAKNYPDVDEYDEEPTGNDDSWLFINNTFANLLGYPHGRESELEKETSVSSVQLKRIYEKWRS